MYVALAAGCGRDATRVVVLSSQLVVLASPHVEAVASRRLLAVAAALPA
jgi:hypothetical protein